MMTEQTFDYWTCDACHRVYPAKVRQTERRVQQRTERIYGTEEMHRPVEVLVICPNCIRQWVWNDD